MKLAIHGGEPVRTKPFPAYRVIEEQEKAAVNRVLDSGILSRYLGCWHDDFYGGPEVQALEKEWAEYFGVRHAIAVNSCTSGLYCAVGAIGVEPGEEIIVSPYTMSASAVAPLVFNAVPIFADIEEDYSSLGSTTYTSLKTMLKPSVLSTVTNMLVLLGIWVFSPLTTTNTSIAAKVELW
jgi:dTDP-4-amino-4,6-dideoxygalactose transaminase